MSTVKVNHLGYTIDGKRYPRVTSILGCMAKPALPAWAAKMVAEFAVQNKEAWLQLADADAIKLLKGAPDSKRDKAADRGSVIHNVLDAYLKGKSLPDFNEDEFAVALSADAFLNDYKPVIVATEVTVYSPAMNYAGTCDLFCRIDGEPWLLDWKTGSGCYPEYALQLHAYSVAERAIVDDFDTPAPWYKPRLGVVHLTPTGYELRPVEATWESRDAAWRALVAVHGWSKEADKALGRAEPISRTVAA